MTKHLLDDLIGTPPQPTVDLATLMRGERRAQAVRRAGYTTTAMAALAVVAGVALGTSGAHDQRPTPSEAQPPAALNTRFELRADTKESAEASAKRLSKALDDALTRAAPDARWVRVKTSDAANPTADGLPQMVAITDQRLSDNDLFSGTTNVAANGNQGALTLIVLGQAKPVTRPGVKITKKPLQLSCADTPNCAESKGPNGERVVVITADNGAVKSEEIRIAVAGNRLLDLTVGIDLHGTAPAQLPLTSAQSIAIAADLASKIK